MPGIVGIIEKGVSEDNTHALLTMVKSMVTEDFYTSGNYVDSKLGLRLGWVCHKGSFSDCMPIWNEKKDILLIFVGEEARDETALVGLKSRGHQCRIDKAEYLVHLYEEQKTGFLEKINGGFCGILVDFRQTRILLFNDRLGLNRIYYYENEQGFYFSSEAKALLKIIPDLRSFDYSSLGEFFSCGCVLENKSLFSGLLLIPGASLWEFTPGGRSERGSYLRHDAWENQDILSEAKYYERLRETWVSILQRYFRQRERLAVSLTGGISSRMIMAWAAFPPFRVPCYTFGGMYHESPDVEIARRIAGICQQHHNTIAIKRNFFPDFPALAKKAVYYTDGTMNVTGAVDLYLNRLAREIAPIHVKGHFGNQALWRAGGLRPRPLCKQIFDEEFYCRVQSGLATLARMRREFGPSFPILYNIPGHDLSRIALESTQLIVRLPFLNNDLLRLVNQAPPESAAHPGLSLRLIAEGFPALRRLPTCRGKTHWRFPVGSKTRPSLLEYGSGEDYAYDFGMPQWLEKIDSRFTALHLEKTMFGRKKIGHFRVWYREELAKYVKDILLDNKTLARPYFNGRGIESIVKKHITGQGNHTVEIHALLTSELIQRHLIKSA